MGEFWCDRCNKGLLLDEEVRYKVRLEVFAAYDPMEITKEDLEKDHDAEIQRILEQLKSRSETQLMDEVHRQFCFDLCPPCQKWLLETLRSEIPSLGDDAAPSEAPDEAAGEDPGEDPEADLAG